MTEIFKPSMIVTAADSFGRQAADVLIGRFTGGQNPLLVLPIGHTPLAVYSSLIAEYGHRRDIWDHARCLTLDEYAGLAPDDSRLFYNWINRAFMDRVGIPAGNRAIFRSDASDADAEAARMEDWLAQNGPIGVAVLGLGMNGHIGFNEPGSAFDSRARLVSLTEESVKANAAYWGGVDRVPRHAFTLGLGTLTKAKEIVLLVNGAHKAGILGRVLNGPVTEDVPATFLRTVPNVTIIADKDAMGLRA